jgi:hypothetical protein
MSKAEDFHLETSRRTLLAIGLAATPLAARAGAAFGQPANGRLAFAIRRNGQPIGREQLIFRTEGEVLSVSIDARMTVKLGPIPLFSYHHQASERWRAGHFDSLESRTTTNGSVEQLVAQRTSAGVAISATKHKLTAPDGAAPLTHWNSRVLTGPLFNPQTGALIRVNVRRGEDPALELASGRKVAAERYTLAGDADIVDWYDLDGVWAALNGKAKDGSTIEFRRI